MGKLYQLRQEQTEPKEKEVVTPSEEGEPQEVDSQALLEEQEIKEASRVIRRHEFNLDPFSFGHTLLKETIQSLCYTSKGETFLLQNLLVLFTLNPFSSRLRFYYFLDGNDIEESYTNLYGLCLGASGSGKTTSARPIVSALRKAWEELHDRYQLSRNPHNVESILPSVIHHLKDYYEVFRFQLDKRKTSTPEDIDKALYSSWFARQGFINEFQDSSAGAIHEAACANRSCCYVCEELKFLCKNKGDSRAIELITWFDGIGFFPNYKSSKIHSPKASASIFFNSTTEWFDKAIRQEGDGEVGILQRFIPCRNNSLMQKKASEDPEFYVIKSSKEVVRDTFPEPMAQHMRSFWESFLGRSLTDNEWVIFPPEVAAKLAKEVTNPLLAFFASFTTVSDQLNKFIGRWRKAIWKIAALVCFHADRNVNTVSNFILTDQDVQVTKEIAFALFKEAAFCLEMIVGESEKAESKNSDKFPEACVSSFYHRLFQPPKKGRSRSSKTSSIEELIKRVYKNPRIELPRLKDRSISRTKCLEIIIGQMLSEGYINKQGNPLVGWEDEN